MNNNALKFYSMWAGGFALMVAWRLAAMGWLL